MRRNITYNLCLSILIAMILFACTSSPESSTIGTGNIVNVSLKDASNPALDDIPFENFSVIPLEAVKESLIGEVSKVMFANNRYHVLDRKIVKGVLVFDEKGKFLYKIRKRGRGPGEYAECYDMEVDQDGNIYVLDVNNRKIVKYDKEGRFAEEFPFETPSMAFSYVAKDTFAMYQFEMPTGLPETEFNLVYWTKEDQSAKRYFPYRPKSGSRQSYVFQNFFKSPNSLLFHLNFSDTLYSVENNGVEAKYVLDFGSNASPQNVAEMKNEEIGKLFEENSYAWKKSSFFENEHYLTGSYQLKDKMGMFIYDKSQAKTRVYSPDHVEWLDLWSTMPMGYIGDDRFYGFIHRENIRFMQDNGDPMATKYPFVKQLLDMEVDQIENPIIVTYEVPKV